MWYFTWVLGLGLAVTLGILNGIWFEFLTDDDADADAEDPFLKPADKARPHAKAGKH